VTSWRSAHVAIQTDGRTDGRTGQATAWPLSKRVGLSRLAKLLDRVTFDLPPDRRTDGPTQGHRRQDGVMWRPAGDDGPVPTCLRCDRQSTDGRYPSTLAPFLLTASRVESGSIMRRAGDAIAINSAGDKLRRWRTRLNPAKDG